jgi:hypothetical protein
MIFRELAKRERIGMKSWYGVVKKVLKEKFHGFEGGMGPL